MHDLFNKFLEMSDLLRPDYSMSLGKAEENWQQIIHPTLEFTSLFQVIYSNVQGTRRGIIEQKLIDFIPGYRLIHIYEMLDEKRILDKLYPKEFNEVSAFPLLVNYSSDYICWVNLKEESYIYALIHDEGEPKLMFRTPEKFLETIIEFYNAEVYFTDIEGYLDYDGEKEGEIGSRLNPGVEYWTS